MSDIQRAAGEGLEDWRKRRQAAAAALAGGMASMDEGLAARVEALAQRMQQSETSLGAEMQKIHRMVDTFARGSSDGFAEIEGRVIKLEAAGAPSVREVSLEGRAGSVRFADRDMLALCLAMFVTFRTGAAVDIPLSDGTVVEALRAGELAEIARQLLEG